MRYNIQLTIARLLAIFDTSISTLLHLHLLLVILLLLAPRTLPRTPPCLWRVCILLIDLAHAPAPPPHTLLRPHHIFPPAPPLIRLARSLSLLDPACSTLLSLALPYPPSSSHLIGVVLWVATTPPPPPQVPFKPVVLCASICASSTTMCAASPPLVPPPLLLGRLKRCKVERIFSSFKWFHKGRRTLT